MSTGEPQPYQSYTDPREAYLALIAGHEPKAVYDQDFGAECVDLLSRRTVPDLVSPFTDELLQLGSFLAIIRGVKVPVWEDHTPSQRPDIADAAWVDGYISGGFMMTSDDGGEQWRIGMGSFGPMRNVPTMPLQGHLCINPWMGIATAGIVYNSEVERLEIELADGSLYSDTVTDRVLNVLAPLKNETNRQGEFTSRLIARGGEIIQEGVIPICPPMPGNQPK